MNIHIHVNSMKEAEHLSTILREFPYEISLRAGRFCVDPKSTLGILAMMYSDRENMLLDTGDMDDLQIRKLTTLITEYIKAENA